MPVAGTAVAGTAVPCNPAQIKSFRTATYADIIAANNRTDKHLRFAVPINNKRMNPYNNNNNNNNSSNSNSNRHNLSNNKIFSKKHILSNIQEGSKGSSHSTNKDKYNQIHRYTIIERKQSTVYKLKLNQNFSKTILINQFKNIHSKLSVLDLCCGAGGDLSKWKHIENLNDILCIDHASVSIEKCKEKYAKIFEECLTKGKHMFKADFKVSDCHLTDFYEWLTPKLQFHIVSCQFAAHYAFESEVRLRGFLKNCSSKLIKGGYVIMTVPNEKYIRYLLQKQQKINEETNQDKNPVIIGDKDIWSIELIKVCEQNRNRDQYGNKYIFYLKDSIDYIPEPYANIELLTELSAEYNLEVCYSQTLIALQESARKELFYEQLYKTMRCEELSIEEQHVVDLYICIVLKKN